VFSDPNSSTTNVSGLVKGKYAFRLTVSDGTEIVSDMIIVDVISIVGIEDSEPGEEIVYPNPVFNNLFIRRIGNSASTEVSLTDPSGRLIIRKTFTEGSDILELDLSGLKNGFYILNINNDQKSTVRPIIKITDETY
jgi:hypothetical protein